jgi:hypothetical protein
MSKESRTLALTAVVTVCIGVLFIYSWTHTGPPTYQSTGARRIGLTPVLGSAFFILLATLFQQIRGKK